MRKTILMILTSVSIGFCSPAFALDGEGTVEELLLCTLNSTTWKNQLFFKLSDGNWFGVYGHYYYSSSGAYSGDSPGQSLVMLAYASKLSVKVRANYAATTRCGVTAQVIWNNNGDYIHLLPQN